MNARVVITGLSVLSSLGQNVREFQDNIQSDVSGIGRISRFDAGGLRCKWAGCIRDSDLIRSGGHMDKYLSMSTRMLAVCCKSLMEDAGYSEKDCRADSVGMIIGSIYGNYEKSTDYISKFTRHGVAGITPMDGIDAGQNPAMDYASIQIQAAGVHKMISSGICSGLDAIGNAYQYIRSGRAVAVIAGGHESIFREMIHCYDAKGLLAQTEVAGEASNKPFDKRRSGILLGEGTALLLLEEYGHAVQRGAKIYAEVVGYANGFASFDDNGRQRAMRPDPDVLSAALKRALLNAEDISYINASANGSLGGDMMEAALISKAFRRSRKQALITSVKGAIGECCGASGGMQCISAVHSIENGVIPPTLNCTRPIYDERSAHVVRRKAERKIEHVMINAFDCYGFSSCLILASAGDVGNAVQLRTGG